MGGTRVVIAVATWIVILATSSVFALTSRSDVLARQRRRIAIGAALAVAVTAAWLLLSPLAAAAVPLAFAAAAAARAPRGETDIAEYVAASDRARSPEPPWWPEFEHEFRRECRRRERARRRSSHPPAPRHDRRPSG